jgi:hypothetical protein
LLQEAELRQSNKIKKIQAHHHNNTYPSEHIIPNLFIFLRQNYNAKEGK